MEIKVWAPKNWGFQTVVLEKNLLRVPWTVRRSIQSILKEINPEYSLEGLMLKLKLQYLGHLMQRASSLEKTLILGKIGGRRRRGQQRMRWLDGITNWIDMLLLLSHFSRVWLCVTSETEPTRLPHPWDSPGNITGVACHFLLQCMKVKNESEVAQSCLTVSNPKGCSLPGSSIHGIFQARVLEWGAIE